MIKNSKVNYKQAGKVSLQYRDAKLQGVYGNLDIQKRKFGFYYNLISKRILWFLLSNINKIPLGKVY